MYGEAAYAETSYADSLQTAVPIIPEVGFETRELVIVVEIDLIAVPVDPISPDPPVPPTQAPWSDGTLWDDGTGWSE